MPLYEYRCDSCGNEFEVRQKFSDAPLTECKSCGGPVRKLISRSGFALKGGGWYAEGYSSGGNGKADTCASAGKSEGCGSCPKAANA
ncbi:MAG: zinc ribbon domain-containing protein [Deltaproteobacteria bacterium]|nr:MAG: zinc ribbon domain-containing protein [Deltaproteobacteria bacterium]